MMALSTKVGATGCTGVHREQFSSLIYSADLVMNDHFTRSNDHLT